MTSDEAAHVEPLYECLLIERNLDGLPSYEFELNKILQPPTLKLTLQMGYEVDHKEGSGSWT